MHKGKNSILAPMTKAKTLSASRGRPLGGEYIDDRNTGLVAFRGDLTQVALDGQVQFTVPIGWAGA